MPIIELPNGQSAEFPEEMPIEEIKSVIRKKFPPQQIQQSQQQKPSMSEAFPEGVNTLEGIANSPGVNAILGFGDAPRKLLTGIANKLYGNMFDYSPSSQGNSYNAGNVAGNIATFLGGGELLNAGRAAAEGIPVAGKLASALGGNGISGMARRAIGNAIGGTAENPENSGEGAAKGAALSVGAELLPAGVKGIGAVAEFLRPQKFTNQLANSIKESYSKSVKRASDLYNPIIEKLGSKNIQSVGDAQSYKNIERDVIKDYFSPSLKKMDRRFLENPTLQNAHDLQSQLGTKIRKFQSEKPDAFTSNSIEAMEEAREILQDDIQAYLKATNSPLANQYTKARSIFKEEVAPYRNNPTIYKIAEGNKKTISPEKLIKSLTTLSESKNKPSKNHYLSEALSKLSDRISRGEAASGIGGIAGGAGIGEALLPSSYGASALLGALLAHKYAPSIIDLATNKTITNVLGKAEPHYQKLTKNLIAQQLADQQGS